jgi:hypothetical protein
LGVQGVERADRKLLDAAALVGHLVPEGSMFWFLATHRGELFADEEFADLFPSGRGRPSLPAPVAASILALQTLYDLSDAETAEAARCDLRWKVAVGMALDDGGFHPSTLTYWRQRLARSARPHRINDAVRRVVEETGIVAGRRRRVVDSTILADAVATQDTVTQLVSAVRRVAREVPGAAAQVQAVCSGHDYSTPGKPRIDWDDPQARDALVSALVNDAGALVAALADAKLDEQQQASVGLLALVAGQDVEPAEGSDGTDGRWRIARKVAADRVISTVDPDARHTRKSPEQRRDGYRAHVAAEPETGIITDEVLTQATGSRTPMRPWLRGSWPPKLPRPPPIPGTPTAMPRPWSGMAIRPTAPGTCATRSPTPGRSRCSSPSRCSRRLRAGSPSTTSPLTRLGAR